MGKTNKNIDSMDICDYMKYLNGRIWEYLFEDALAHETIFSSLSELEQIIISRLLFVQQVVSERAMRLWINPNYLKNLSEGIKNLVENKILVANKMNKDNYFQYKINDKFRFTLLNKIYRNMENNIFIFNNNIKEQLQKEKELYENNLFPTKEDIFQHTQIKWNNLLYFIASPQKQNMKNDREQWKEEKEEDKKRQRNEPSARFAYGNRRILKKASKHWGQHNGEDIDNEEEAEEQFDEDKYLYDDNEVEKNTEEEHVRELEDEEFGEEEESEEESEEEIEEKENNNSSNNNVKYGMENGSIISDGKYSGEKNKTFENNKDYENYANHYKKKKGKIKQKKKKISRNPSSSNNSGNCWSPSAKKTNTYGYQDLTSYQNNNMSYLLIGNETRNDINKNYALSHNCENKNGKIEEYKKKTLCAPNDSVIEILKRKNFISNESNKNKVISMSREAFSWFLKDLRSRIISLVLEYLLVIDAGNVTTIAKELLIKYEKKKETDKSKKNESNAHTSNNNTTSTNTSTIGNENTSYATTQYGRNIHMNTTSNMDIKQKELEAKKKKHETEEVSYAAQTNKDAKRSEMYVKETLLFILSVCQCNISQPIFLKNLTKAQKEFVDFGSHIGLFYKTNENYIFITPYALLLNTNNSNTNHYISLINNLSIQHLCDKKWKKNLSEKYFHKYLLIQETNNICNKHLEKKEEIRRTEEIAQGKEGDGNGRGIVLNQNMMSRDDRRKMETTDVVGTGTETVAVSVEMSSMQPKLDLNNFIDSTNDNNNLEIGLIVQSNFKVYLYTSSLLKINILSHLCELQARLPNMVVGLLTRKSVLNAFTSGITANQIIKFLESYSHPFNKNCKNTIPNNVIAQLKLWESERHRLTFEDAIVFKSWERELLPYLYQQIVIWSNNKNYLLYYTPWPKNNTKEFERWMKSEKYLCCIYESKNEVIEKIKEVREILLKKKEKRGN